MTKSAQDCINSNDMDEAFERFKNANGRWQKHWWNAIITIYDNNSDWSAKYWIDRDNCFICIAKKRRNTTRQENGAILWNGTEIAYLGNTELKDTPAGEKAYFFKFFDSKADNPIFDKIGTTTKYCFDRLKDEIRYYKKRGFEIERVEICEIWDCGEVPAESYESFMRALLIKKYPNTWRKNDRFFGTDIPTELFTSICKQYETL